MVTTATFDLWTNSGAASTVLRAPANSEVMAAIEALDGHTLTTVALSYSNGSTLLVGGGPIGFVVIFGQSDEDLWTLESAAPSGGAQLLCIGGQEGEYPAEIVVSAAEAMLAATHFLQRGERAGEQAWRKEV